MFRSMVTNTASTSGDLVPEEDASEFDTPAFRQLPRNIEAERGLLGAIFVDNRAMEQVAEFLRAEHFALTAHARIYEAMNKLIDRGQIADPTTLRPYFEADNSLEDIGGAQYLAHLAASAINVINAREYGRIIYDMHLRRELIALGERVVNDAYENDIDLEGACDGSLACSTCHVVLEQEYFDMLPEPEEEEEDMLDLAFGLTDTSRLGCQIKLTKELEGIRATIPGGADNMLPPKG